MNYIILNSASNNVTPLFDWCSDSKENYFYLLTKKNKLGFYCENVPSNVEIIKIENWETNEIEYVCNELKNKTNITRVINFAEQDILRTEKINNDLFKCCISNGCVVFRDKYVMKEQFKKNQLASPPFAKVDNFVDIVNFIEDNGYPVILKSRFGFGSIDIYKIDSYSDLEKIAKENTLNDMLIEKFVFDDVYHVDGLIIDDELKLLNVSKYITTCFEHTQGTSVQTAMISKQDAIYKEIKKFTDKAISFLPFPSTAAFHLEVFVSQENEVRLCEIACRTGGALINDTNILKYGIDFNEIVFLDQIKSKKLENYKIEDNDELFGFILSAPKVGQLVEYPTHFPQNWICQLDVFAKVGNTYSSVSNCNFATAGVIVKGDTTEQICERLSIINNYIYDNSEYNVSEKSCIS